MSVWSLTDHEAVVAVADKILQAEVSTDIIGLNRLKLSRYNLWLALAEEQPPKNFHPHECIGVIKMFKN